jgi:hypothetical protein
MTSIYLAPGHVYVERLGTGIDWSPGVARLYQGGEVSAEGRHATATAWAFWHTLAFAEAFPQVESWWFRSVWTNRVRLSAPQGMQDSTTVYGYVQFLDEETPGALWTLADAGDVWELDVPYPPNEVQPLNVPLRLALARCVVGVINDDLSPNAWYDLTSVVGRAELAAAFPTSGAALNALLPRRLATLVSPSADDDPLPEQRPVRLVGFDSSDLRAAWCGLMGLELE